jgi:hypothetical protein
MKVGDKVKVLRVEPNWDGYVSLLKDYVGKTGIVSAIDHQNGVRINFGRMGWYFRSDWLEIVDEDAIQYEVLPCSNNILVRITKQIFRGPSFFHGKYSFAASNGLTLVSDFFPEILLDTMVCLQGNDKSKDNDILIFPNKELFSKFEVAVAEYNKAVDNDEYIAEVKSNLIDFILAKQDKLNDCIKSIEKADTVEAIMNAKIGLMADLINLPLAIDHCVYCIKNHNVCLDCDYGKRHKPCRHGDSDYRKLKNKVLELREIILNYY